MPLSPREVQALGDVRHRFLRNEPEPALYGVQDEQQRSRHMRVLVENVAEFFPLHAASLRRLTAVQPRRLRIHRRHVRRRVIRGDAAMRTQPILGLLLFGLVAGCASHGTMYSRNDAGKPWTVQEATVVQVTEATI